MYCSHLILIHLFGGFTHAVISNAVLPGLVNISRDSGRRDRPRPVLRTAGGSTGPLLKAGLNHRARPYRDIPPALNKGGFHRAKSPVVPTARNLPLFRTGEPTGNLRPAIWIDKDFFPRSVNGNYWSSRREDHFAVLISKIGRAV